MPFIHFTFKPGRASRAGFLRTWGLACAAGLSCVVASCWGNNLQAAEATRVVSAGDDDNPYDLNLSLFYAHEARRGHLMRESTSPTGIAERVPDQIFQQTRDTLNVRMDIGLLPDVGLFLNLPIVIADNRTLSFDGTDASTSSLLRDQLLPGFGQGTYGIDAVHGRSFTSPSSKTFAGPTRQGLEYLAFGFNWAMFNQKRVESEPTWLLGFEARVDVSKTMRFDPSKPKANTAVGPGYHQMLVHTMASRRFGPLEPYVGGWYMFPIKTASSPFEKQGSGSSAMSNPQQRAYLAAGLQGTVWERPNDQQSISLELRMSVQTRFLGLARSDLWEPLSGSSTCAATPAVGCRPGLDNQDVNGDGTVDPNSGITRSPSYGIFGGDVGLNVRAGEHVRFRGFFGMTAEQDRFMTDGRSASSSIDGPGRRFYVKDAYGYHLLLDGAILF